MDKVGRAFNEVTRRSLPKSVFFNLRTGLGQAELVRVSTKARPEDVPGQVIEPRDLWSGRGHTTNPFGRFQVARFHVNDILGCSQA